MLHRRGNEKGVNMSVENMKGTEKEKEIQVWFHRTSQKTKIKTLLLNMKSNLLLIKIL